MVGIDNKIKKGEKGMTLLEALVSTAIIGIGFVAVFQMVNYSVQSIDVSGERTKANYLVSMVAEDLISEKESNSPTKDVKFMDYLISNKNSSNLHGEWDHVHRDRVPQEILLMLLKINLKSGMIVLDAEN